MSQQALDMRKSVQIVRRHKIFVSVVTVLGLLAGAGYALVYPSMLASTALVVLPQAASQDAQTANAGSVGTSSYMDTQVVVASSDPVLSTALPNIKPPVSLRKLQSEISVKATTDSILAITASGTIAAQAEATANAVASGYVTYVGSSSSRVGRIPANVLQSATVATRPSLAEQLIIYGIIGALGGALVGVLAALVRGREDPRLRERDEIASSIGLPVLASFPVAHPSSAEAWSKLLAEYQPGPVHAWQLHRLLRQLGIGEVMTNGDVGRSGCSITILSLSSDPKALALGPQLAVFAASQGIPTALVISEEQEPDAAVALRVACAAPPSSSPDRPADLRVCVHSSGDMDDRPDALLTIVVLVIDPGLNRVPAAMRTVFTMLGVSAGAVTAEQLARAAVLATANRREINGIIVADPDPDDRTTGRVPQMPRPTHRRQPTRVESMATETGR